jgi:hypothetical protein
MWNPHIPGTPTASYLYLEASYQIAAIAFPLLYQQSRYVSHHPFRRILAAYQFFSCCNKSQHRFPVGNPGEILAMDGLHVSWAFRHEIFTEVAPWIRTSHIFDPRHWNRFYWALKMRVLKKKNISGSLLQENRYHARPLLIIAGHSL